MINVTKISAIPFYGRVRARATIYAALLEASAEYNAIYTGMKTGNIQTAWQKLEALRTGLKVYNEFCYKPGG